ncbi:putative non-specific serine/threonine protein kinase [Helianthus anomalus]
MTLVECEKSCKSNCSCTAYTNSNISGTGSGCLLWYDDLVDIRTVPQNGDTLYIRVPHSEIGKYTQYGFIFITHLMINYLNVK